MKVAKATRGSDCQILVYGVEQNVNEPALIVQRVLKDQKKRRKTQKMGLVQTVSEKGWLENKGKRKEEPMQRKGFHCPLYEFTSQVTCAS